MQDKPNPAQYVLEENVLALVSPTRGELKRVRRGRISGRQEEGGAHLERCGFVHLCAQSFEEAVAMLKEQRILRGGIKVQ